MIDRSGEVLDKRSLDVCVRISRAQTRDECPITPIQMKSIVIELRSEPAEEAAAASSDRAAAVSYYYRDQSQQEQGPFSLEQMRAW
jgi:hypothetical protein